MKAKIILQIRLALQKSSDEKTKSGFQRFFKEEVKFHGVKSSTVSKIAREFFEKIKNKNNQEIFVLCEELLKSGYCEEAWISANWADRVSRDFQKEDIEIFERWVSLYIDNWAECDTLCNHAVGALIEKFPVHLIRLKKWAAAENKWLRRAAAVSLIIPAKKGEFLEDILEIAGILLLDEEDLVQKGYGWMLKVASRKNQKEIFGYVMKNKKVMPRTALRYAIEKMPETMRKQAMAK